MLSWIKDRKKSRKTSNSRMPFAFGIVVSQINNYNIGKTLPALMIGINLIFKAGIFNE